MLRHGIACSLVIAFSATSPLLAQVLIPETDKVVTADGVPFDDTGETVAIDGDVMVAGGTGAADFGPNSGAAWVFERCGHEWTEVARLVAPDGFAADQFGGAVAVSGNTIAIGSPRSDLPILDSGAVYLFERVAGVWTFNTKLISPEAIPVGWRFGSAVAIDGDQMLIGAPFNNSGGAAYTFSRSGTNWSFQSKLTGPPTVLSDSFGSDVDLDGDRAVVGARSFGAASIFSPGPGASFLFDRTGGTWTQVAMLTASNAQPGDEFGSSVGIEGSVAVVGARRADPSPSVADVAGAAYIFEEFAGSWSETAILTSSAPLSTNDDEVGAAVAIASGRIYLGIPKYTSLTGPAPRVSVYENALGSWSETSALVPADAFFAPPQIGVSVAADGTRACAAAPADGTGSMFLYEFATIPANCVCVDPPTTLERQQIVASGGGPGQQFGQRVAIGNGVAFASAPDDDQTMLNSGAVYVLTETAGAWIETAKLKASSTINGLFFGFDLDFDPIAETLVVGSNQEKAFVVEKVAGAWGITATLTQLHPTMPNLFGETVAVSGNRIAIGAPNDDDVAADAGAVFIFERVGSLWTEITKLKAGDGVANDQFGFRVALSGNTLAVTARGLTNGSVYVFENTAGNWVQQARLIPGDGAANDQFGQAIDLDGDLLAIGSERHDALGTDSGAVHLFEDVSGTWTQTGKLLADDGEQAAFFGSDVAVDGGRVGVGARLASSPGLVQGGRLYAFEKLAGTWSMTARMQSSSAHANAFLSPIDLHDGFAIGGAPGTSDLGEFAGVAYRFDLRFRSYGCGCPGSAGFVPRLSVSGDPTPGGTLNLSITDGLGGATGLLFLGSQAASIPAIGPCSLLTAPLFPIQLPFVLGGSGPADGTWGVSVPLPPTPLTVTIGMQAWLADSGPSYGISTSNGVIFTIE